MFCAISNTLSRTAGNSAESGTGDRTPSGTQFDVGCGVRLCPIPIAALRSQFGRKRKTDARTMLFADLSRVIFKGDGGKRR